MSDATQLRPLASLPWYWRHLRRPIPEPEPSTDWRQDIGAGSDSGPNDNIRRGQRWNYWGTSVKVPRLITRRTTVYGAIALTGLVVGLVLAMYGAVVENVLLLSLAFGVVGVSVLGLKGVLNQVENDLFGGRA